MIELFNKCIYVVGKENHICHIPGDHTCELLGNHHDFGQDGVWPKDNIFLKGNSEIPQWLDKYLPETKEIH